MAKYVVKYPSGRKFTVRGELKVCRLSEDNPALVPVVGRFRGEAWILDSRAIIKTKGKVVYWPRDNMAGLDRGFAQWMTEHPEWAPGTRN